MPIVVIPTAGLLTITVPTIRPAESRTRSQKHTAPSLPEDTEALDSYPIATASVGWIS